MEHTELPWKVKWQHEGGWTIGTDDEALIEVSNIGITHEKAEEIAKHIVKCHNAFPAMEKAIEGLIRDIEALDMLRHPLKSVDAAKAALAAEGE